MMFITGTNIYINSIQIQCSPFIKEKTVFVNYKRELIMHIL